MGRLTADLVIALDGCAAGPDQRPEKPFEDLDQERQHSRVFEHGDDHSAEVAAVTQAAVHVMGRDVPRPGRGERDRDRQGRWVEEPPCHAPAFVLTHSEHVPPATRGGTTSTSVTGGIERRRRTTHPA